MSLNLTIVLIRTSSQNESKRHFGTCSRANLDYKTLTGDPRTVPSEQTIHGEMSFYLWNPDLYRIDQGPLEVHQRHVHRHEWFP